MDDTRYMKMALQEAAAAGERGEVPVGAVLVGKDGKVLARNGNRCIEYHDPAGHAELLVLRQAGTILRNYRLLGTTLYATIEPCAMCAGAMVHARISRLVFGAADPKTGAAVSLYQIPQDQRLNHRIEVQSGIMAEECAMLLKDFFKSRRNGREH